MLMHHEVTSLIGTLYMCWCVSHGTHINVPEARPRAASEVQSRPFQLQQWLAPGLRFGTRA